MKILVLGGGSSLEREVWLRSARGVAEALRQSGFEVIEADPDDEFEVFNDIDVDTVVFPILYGAGGEDGVIQAEMERRNLAFLGSDSKAADLCFDKGKMRLALADAGLPVANGGVVSKDTYSQHQLTESPHVLKVTTGGSSIGTYLVHDPKSIDQVQVEEVFSLGPEAVIEELIEGTEITVPVLDKTALPVIETRPPEGSEFNYENKYNGATQELCPPLTVDEATQARARQLAEQAHAVLGCRHLSRTDMMVRPDGEIIILETNVIPGMTDQSLYPKSAKVAGYPMPELVKHFAEMIKRDYKLGEK